MHRLCYFVKPLRGIGFKVQYYLQITRLVSQILKKEEVFMKTLIGGAVAAVLGIIGITVWWGFFLQLLAGAVPVMLLLGGALAIYLGFDELKDSWKKDEFDADDSFKSDDSDKYKEEIDDLKKEVETPKEDKGEEKEAEKEEKKEVIE